MKGIFSRIVLLAVLFRPVNGHAQANILLNGGFEEVNTCTEYRSECAVEGWFYLKEVKVQMLLNETNAGLVGANSYGIFCTWKGYTDFTPVIGAVLPCGLQNGKRYTFRGLLSAKLHPKLILQPGVCLGEKFYVPGRPFSKTLQPKMISTITPVANTPFFSFEYSFIADGRSKYLTFGTYTKEDTTGAKKKLYGVQTISLVLDNFQLIPEDPNETVCPDYLLNKENIYAYNYRHREMDYSLFGKGDLAIEIGGDPVRYTTTVKSPPPPPQTLKADTLKLGDVFFDFNKSKLKTPALTMLSSYFSNNKQDGSIDSIRIEGHTDSIGNDKQNLLLSSQRCESVRNWLLQNNVVSANQSSIRPFGRSRPVASNKTLAGRALNRRVEIIVFRKVSREP